MLSRVRNDLTKFNINERQMKRYEKYITKFDKSILSGSIFTKCIESKFEVINNIEYMYICRAERVTISQNRSKIIKNFEWHF